MDISAKYCIAHSRAWATGRMYAVLIYRIAYLHSCYIIVGSKEEIAMSCKTDVVVSSTARGAAKKAIEINLLTHCRRLYNNRGSGYAGACLARLGY